MRKATLSCNLEKGKELEGGDKMAKSFASFLLVFGVHTALPQIILGSSQKRGVTRATFSLSFTLVSKLLPNLYIFEICPLLSAPLPLPDERYLLERITAWLVFQYTYSLHSNLFSIQQPKLKPSQIFKTKFPFKTKTWSNFPPTPPFIKMLHILPITFKNHNYNQMGENTDEIRLAKDGLKLDDEYTEIILVSSVYVWYFPQ